MDLDRSGGLKIHQNSCCKFKEIDVEIKFKPLLPQEVVELMKGGL